MSGEKPVFTGSFKPGNGWQEVKFNKPVTGRYVCIEALNSQDGKDLACIAEMYFLDKDGSNRLSREPWTVKYADSEDVAHVNLLCRPTDFRPSGIHLLEHREG